jgi:enoyl-CoA hydratase/carnithine racemase
LGLTGASFNGVDAKFVGLADRYVSHNIKDTVLHGLCAMDLSIDAGLAISKLLHQFEATCIVSQPLGNVQSHYDQIQSMTDADTVPELFDSITAYSGDDQWMTKAVAGLANGCPITPYLVQEQLVRTRHLSLADIFRLELIMSTNCAKRGHFKEGVRALLIDKDRNPQWLPKTVSEVSREEVESFFECPWSTHPLAEL